MHFSPNILNLRSKNAPAEMQQKDKGKKTFVQRFHTLSCFGPFISQRTTYQNQRTKIKLVKTKMLRKNETSSLPAESPGWVVVSSGSSVVVPDPSSVVVSSDGEVEVCVLARMEQKLWGTSITSMRVLDSSILPMPVQESEASSY